MMFSYYRGKKLQWKGKVNSLFSKPRQMLYKNYEKKKKMKNGVDNFKIIKF